MSANQNSKYLYTIMLQARQGFGTAIFVPALAMTGWLGMTFLSNATVMAFSTNDYAACASRLLKAGVSADAASRACATALRPRDLSNCVTEIKNKTNIAATDALSTCGKAWRPKEVATCVVGINKNTDKGANQVFDKQLLNRSILNNCGLSLLPVRFAQCVVGLRSQIDNLAPIQAINTCISASDYATGYLPSFIPANTSNITRPSVNTNPIPSNQNTPNNLNTNPVPGNQNNPNNR